MTLMHPTPAPLADPLAEGERIEMAALAAAHAVACDRTRRALGLSLVRVGGALASAAAALPASAIVVNRAMGLAAPPDAAALEAIRAHYAAQGIARHFLHLPPGMAGDDARLRAAGYGPARGWQKFLRTADAPLPEAPRHDIRHVGPQDADRWGRAFAELAAQAFDLGPWAEHWLARLPLHPDWQVFLSFDGGRPAACGALFRRGDAGWTDWAATDPAFRRRGHQRALLAHRVRLAHAQGIARLHSCTGKAVAGDPQHSFANLLRCGFAPTRGRGNAAPLA